MEHAPLRPVPARPAGPIDPATAVREVEAWLPTLAPETAQALALVVLAERPRAEVAELLALPEPELGSLLAAARKELRQTMVVLGGSGWCERAEGLISDRLDGTLADRDARRLDVHLRNCTRCVEHERRLVQATDALIAGAGGLGRSPAPLADPPALVEATPPEGSTEEMNPAEAEATAPAPHSEQSAAAAEVPVARRTRRQTATAVAWNSLIAIAIVLTIATIALAIAGILGANP
jgi:putative zinc finger protein